MTFPRIVSESAAQELDKQKDKQQPRTIFAEEFSADRFVKVIVYGDWDDDMAEAITSFMDRRRKIQQAPGV